MAKRRLNGLASTLGFPATVSPYVPDIHIEGTQEVSVEGCRGILEYEKDRIVLRLCNKCVMIQGSRLTMRSYFGNHIRIMGDIISVSFLEGYDA